MQTGSQLCHLFVTILLFGLPSRPQNLWTEFWPLICSNLWFRITQTGTVPPETITNNMVADYGLFFLAGLLQKSNCLLDEWPHMPQPQQNWDFVAQAANSWIMEAQAYNQNKQAAIVGENVPCLNVEQCHFCLNGSAGTGKTFVYRTVCAQV